MRVSVAAAAACGAFLMTGLALGAASFTDTSDDNNAAPDITSIEVSEPANALVNVVVRVGNYDTLPLDSWLDVWFDEDSDETTGFDGDETVVRYSSNGTVQLFEWDGFVMVGRPLPAGTTASFASGALTMTVPNATVGGDSAFGVSAVAVRRQVLIVAPFLSTDFAPDRDRFAYTGPGLATFTDNGNDEDAAPDITGARVTDTKDGWISFSVTTPNYATLTDESALFVAIDSDNRAAISDIDSAVELRVTYFRGDVFLERWDGRNGGWVQDVQTGLVRARNSGGVVTIDLRRSALGSTQRFGFALTAMDLDGAVGTVRAVDQAPDSGGFFRYAFANRPALVLVAAGISATPAQPRAGRAFAVELAVRRSDTNRGITAGRVTCTAKLGGKPLTGRGSVVRGAGRCSFAIPRDAAGRLQGRITVRVAGVSVAAGFAYVVR